MKDSQFQLLSLVCLAFAVRCSGQCPIRPYNDPPGWAVEHSGRSRIEARILSPDGQWIAFSTTDGVVWLREASPLLWRRPLEPAAFTRHYWPL